MANEETELPYEPKSYFEEKIIAYVLNRKSGLAHRSPHAQCQRERTSSFDSIISNSESERVRNKRHSFSFLEHISKPFKEISLSRAPSLDRLLHPKDDLARPKSVSDNIGNSCVKQTKNLKRTKSSEESNKIKLRTSLFFQYDDDGKTNSQLSDVGLRHQSLLEADGLCDSQSFYTKPSYFHNNLNT